MNIKSFIVNPVSKMTSVLVEFFNTAPDIMSEDTARKLQDKDEAKKLMKEIQIKRDKNGLYEAELNI